MPRTAWNALHLEELLTLDAAGEGRWRSRHGDANRNGRSYGGQLLGQAMMAALMDVPAGRAATMMQFLFLQGAMPEEAVDFQVTALQEGKRFSSRHVRGRQGKGRTVLDAQVTCALPLAAPTHAAHLRDLNGRKLYISSLNHALWLHRPVRADQWLHVDCTSPCAQAGRGLSIGSVHDQQGRPLATMTQECLMAYAG
jgi:acyl-CoA thioesterase